MPKIPKMRNTLILIRLISRKEERVGSAGLIMPETNGQDYSHAEVIEVGPGTVVEEKVRSETFDLKAGQRVFIKTHSRHGPQRIMDGMEMTVNGEQLMIVEQGSILAIIDEAGDWNSGQSETAEVQGPPTKPLILA